MTPNPRSVIIADDHPMLRAAMTHALRQMFPAVDIVEAGTLAGLERVVMEHSDADFVLLDLNMPGAQGFSALVLMRRQYPALPVVVVSATEDARTMRRARQFGASAFIPKSSGLEHITEAVRAVMDGGEWFPTPARGAADEADSQLSERLAELTPQQFRVLMCLADGLPNKRIADALGTSENTVKIHVTAVLKKLKVDSRTQAALVARDLDLAP